jgi:hypothetical protein
MARTVQQYFLDWCCEGCFFFWVQTSRPKILRSCLDLWWFVNKRGQSSSKYLVSRVPKSSGPIIAKISDKEFLRTERHVHF